MHRLSCLVTDHLFQELALKAQVHEISLSDSIRECLQMGLKYFRQDLTALAQKNETALQKRIATHTLFTYCLLEHYIKSTLEKGEQLCEIAESKAEKLTVAMLNKN